MMQILLIGISAGAAAALLFASLFSGSLLTLVLGYVMPLPILIAGIGWNYTAGLIATVFAAICIGVMFDGTTAVAYAINFGLPAWWLAYVTLLGRPAQTHAEAMEWYPPGQIVLWAAALGIAASVTIMIAFAGPDFDSIKTNLMSAVRTLMNLQGQDIDSEKIVNADAFAKVVTAIMAWLLTALFIANCWLAAKLVKLSGQLRRSWPDLSATRIPVFTPLIFALSLAGIMLPGLPGMVAAIVAGAFIVVFAVIGLAVLHVVTRGMDARPFILGGVYVALVLFYWLVWPPLLLTLLGLADTALDLRGRSTATRGPPTLQ